MTHASTETLVALLDGELSKLEERRFTRHLESCGQCAAELAELAESRTLFAWALHRVDAAEPLEWNAGIAAAEGARAPTAVLGAASSPPSQGHGTRSRLRLRQTALRWAAGLVLLAGAAAGAIVTPIIVDRVFTSTPSPSGVVPRPAPRPGSALAVRLLDGAAVVTLTGPVERTRMQVEFEQRDDVMIEYRGAAPAFLARDGEISVRLAGAGTELRLRIPADARDVRVLVDGETAVVLAEGEVVQMRTNAGVMFEVVDGEH